MVVPGVFPVNSLVACNSRFPTCANLILNINIFMYY
jgi:hypothetical protein